MTDNPGNPVTFQPGAQAQPGELDTRAAAAAMALYGLDPAGDDAIEFARHWTEDANRNDPHNRDRYSRAAQAAATSKQQAEAMQRMGNFDARLANDPDILWKIASYQAAPNTEQTRRFQSVLDTTDPGELFRMSQGKGELVPDYENDSVNAAAWRRMQDAGVTIEDSDPEAKMIDLSSPERFLASVDRAIQAKQAKSVYEITDPNELWELAKKQGLI